MNINSFFKVLNKKINNYDKIAINPFIDKNKMVIVWIEECNYDNLSNDKNKTD